MVYLLIINGLHATEKTGARRAMIGGRSVQARPEGGPVVAKKGVKRNGGYRVWTGLHGEGRGKEKLLSLHYK